MPERNDKPSFEPNCGDIPPIPSDHTDLVLLSLSSDGKKMHLDPRNMSLGSIKLVLVHQVFTTRRVRVRYEHSDFINEITPQQLRDARMHWTEEDRERFLDEKAKELSYADKIIIEHLEEVPEQK